MRMEGGVSAQAGVPPTRLTLRGSRWLVPPTALLTWAQDMGPSPAPASLTERVTRGAQGLNSRWSHSCE